MDVFALQEQLLARYAQFARSFTTIRAADIKKAVDAEYAQGHFWPSPLIQLNPNFVAGDTVDALAAQGDLDRECARIFRIKTEADAFGQPLKLHRHQQEAIAVAKRQESFVVTTGTGSGKSLCYFIPIVDSILQAKRAGRYTPGIAAIVVYPMNALCNSQRQELEKYLRLGYGEGQEPVTFARYTGQETQAERNQITLNPPDILMTNYYMLELLMTRLQETDKAIRQHAQGLQFLVLDELHTYRGRQGADVALLARRMRERFNEDLQCIGTSATMASEGEFPDPKATVADVASQLFGTTVQPASVIMETLETVTAAPARTSKESLAAALDAGVPDPDYATFHRHPVSAWIERNLGLEERSDGTLARISRPLTLEQATRQLARDSGRDIEVCRRYLQCFLIHAYGTAKPNGHRFFAFRLHQFISGAWNAYASLEPPGRRWVALQGQRFTPGNRERRLFNLAFCRHCGQEYFPIWAQGEGTVPAAFRPRELTDRASDDDAVQYGYLTPSQGLGNPAILYPDEWLEPGTHSLKYAYRKYQPQRVAVDTSGQVANGGMPFWFIPGGFRFCLNPACDVVYAAASRSDWNRLSGLSSEGRSSATTVLALTVMRLMMDADLDDASKKLLAFTDNRQDASLQAGHFNDFIQVLLLRGALLAAMEGAETGCLTDEVLAQRTLEHLRLDSLDYAANPQTKGIRATQAQAALRDVLGYRLYVDLQRGWRLTNPNLEHLGLLAIRYKDLQACCEAEEDWQEAHPLLAQASAETRLALCQALLEHMRKHLCIKTLFLDHGFQDRLKHRSYNELVEPWGLGEEERMTQSCLMIPRPRRKDFNVPFRTVHVSHLSRLGRDIRSGQQWGDGAENLDADAYNALIDGLLEVLTLYGYVEPTPLREGWTGYQINSAVLEWHRDDASPPPGANAFFRHLYRHMATWLGREDRLLHRLEAREHTAQVDSQVREEREERFRRGLAHDRLSPDPPQTAGLPILFCSPTMELGVDIATLNMVYMRNVPPTPANYAQRSGRAGRSGQPALVVTYCAAKSPHDQYFFAHQPRMVAGQVNPPAIDLANEDLIRSHLHAMWLAETGLMLGPSVSQMLDLDRVPDLPLHREIDEPIEDARVLQRTEQRARRILAMLSPHLTRTAAPWYSDMWLEGVIKGIPPRFRQAFDRWRSLYDATHKQMQRAHAVIMTAATPENQRKDAKARYDEADIQQRILLATQSQTLNSDFYTYRYLAAEGFLPGYNFPRLPLMAFIPGRDSKRVRHAFLSRPRFLGLSEFGPQSIIYHEGSTYRVKRTLLTIRPDGLSSDAAQLPVMSARLCPECGYGYWGEDSQAELCRICEVRLTEGRNLRNLYRIEQVTTQRHNRISSDEEERQRRGYEMVTALRFAAADGALRVRHIPVTENGDALLTVSYGPSATLWRINLGWRRRKAKTVYGFSMDANTGEWTKDDQAPTDVEFDSVENPQSVIRITPFVEDTKNVLVLRPATAMAAESLCTLQYALKRGIEQVFQLEEAELAVEPLPDSQNRKAILLYEAAEGGAGVLTRLVHDPEAMRRVARQALQVCHYASRTGAWQNAEDLHDQTDDCEAGCYRCLLSYYNQLDHDLIDRKDDAVLDLLCRLARCTFASPDFRPDGRPDFRQLRNACTSTLEREWLAFLRDEGYRLPDRAQFYLEDFKTRPDFEYRECQVAVFIDGPHHETESQRQTDQAISRRLDEGGYIPIRFNTDRAAWPSIIAEFPWVFGPGHGKVSEP